MVKVISVHHFLSQDVSSIPRPSAVTMAGQNVLLMATESLSVEVRDLKQSGKGKFINHVDITSRFFFKSLTIFTNFCVLCIF